MLLVQMTHQQMYVHIAATTTPHCNEPPQLHNHSRFSFCIVHTNIRINI